MKRLFGVLGILCPLFSLCQQAVGTTVPKVEDSVPYATFQTINLAKGQLTKQDITINKPTMLCFFASWCSTCYKELPKLAAAQQQYKGRLQVVLVTYESEAQWQTAKQKKPFYASLTLPVITGDTVLRQTFPYRFVPHTIWIGADGVVQAVTTAEELTAANLEAFASGKSLAHLYQKQDVMEKGSGPLLADSAASFQSALGHYLPGRGTRSGIVTSAKTARRYWCNQPVLALYANAVDMPANRFVLEGLDENLFYIPDTLTHRWKEQALYTYELTLPTGTSADKRRSLMLQDLNRYLGFWGRIEKRKQRCWVLQRTGNAHLSPTDGKALMRVDNENESIILQNVPISRLVNAFSSSPPAARPMPLVLDETRFTAPVTMTLKGKLTDPAALNTSLQAYGFQLIPAERYVEVFVLSPAAEQQPSIFNSK